jgi:tetratricopeptide (TPR) repeat protein
MAQGKNTSNRQLLVESKDAESQGDAGKAIMLYQQAVKNNPRQEQEQAWQRLMVLYRRQQNYAGELKVINLALKTYETHTWKMRQKWLQVAV